MGDLHPVEEALDLGNPAASGDRLEGERGHATAALAQADTATRCPSRGQLPMEGFPLLPIPEVVMMGGSGEQAMGGVRNGAEETQCPQGGVGGTTLHRR